MNCGYTKKVMKHFMNPPYAGEIKNADAIGEIANDKCGDIMKIYLKVGEGKIEEIKFQTLGCPAAIASSDVLCSLADGKTLEEAEKISEEEITRELGGLPSIKVHCSILGMKALRKTIANYKENINKKQNN